MTTTTCPHCHKGFESGPLYCPHCFMKIPAVMRPPAPASPPPAGRDSHQPVARRAREHAPRKAREPKGRAAAAPSPSGQCPACSHPITAKDEWCKWCHWPVNRKP